MIKRLDPGATELEEDKGVPEVFERDATRRTTDAMKGKDDQSAGTDESELPLLSEEEASLSEESERGDEPLREGEPGGGEGLSELAGLDEVPAAPAFPKHPTADDLVRLDRSLEALLFASTESLSAARLAEALGVPVQLCSDRIELLRERLDEEERPYELREHGGAYRLYTRPEFYPYLLRLRSLRKVERLTPAALETLAIVAYRQPVIRAEIEAIRGVRAGPLLRALLDRKLIRVVGRADAPGAPLQYGTTQRFLDRFGLTQLSDLPSLKEFQQGRI